MDAHKEIHFENFIVDYLTSEARGTARWLQGESQHYDTERALFPEDVIGFIRDSQPEAWAKLEKLNGPKTEQAVLDRLAKVLTSEGTLEVLRRGMGITGAGKVTLCQSLPEDGRNDTVLRQYAANRLRVVRQLRYSAQQLWSIDLVLFINGIPVATVELKSDFTQGIFEAKKQYREDRLPKHPATGKQEPLLTFKRGALVHFAMSTSEIWMTTRLQGASTYFLPFNQGNDGGAGNPPPAIDAPDGEYAVQYFWQKILQRDNFIRIFQRFMLLEKEEKLNDNGRPYIAETMIFPRFHQWEAVMKLGKTVRTEGPGHRYLIQHSAGSGKTNTISWLCHELIRLRQQQGEKYFDSVIVVTDRNVLDSQLQDAIQQIDHQQGVVCAIDREGSSLPKSQQLAEALLGTTPIVVVTIQTFPFAMEAILSEQTLANRNFAVVIDEAHTSQGGSAASKLRATLALKNDEMEGMSTEELLRRMQEVRKFPTNVSYFAFTATPKYQTLSLFGRPGDPTAPVDDKNPPLAFHVYTMQQAIEENFILDVLQNYVSHKVAFKVSEGSVADYRVDGKQAKRAFGKWFAVNPGNVSQKVEFIVEHFVRNVAGLLEGNAKAMVVTGSRASAVAYKLAFDRYVNRKDYRGLQAMVAFSGKVRGEDVDKNLAGEQFDESNLNPGLNGREIRRAFDTPEYQLMIVANKFQTGFDQPKLVAMYLDKRVSGVEAVQTLSRLNRKHRGKDRTYVVDFANDADEILSAFRQFYKAAYVEESLDTDKIYDMKKKLDSTLIYRPEEVRQLGEELARELRGASVRQAKLLSITAPAVERFNKRLKELNDAVVRCEQHTDSCSAAGDTAGANASEAKRSEFAKQRAELMMFKADLGKYVRFYEYVAQLVEFGDEELETLAVFCKVLIKPLHGVRFAPVDLSALRLSHFAIRQGKLLEERIGGEEGNALSSPNSIGEGVPRDPERGFLSELLAMLNELYGSDVSDEDKLKFVRDTGEHLMKNAKVMAQIENNSREQALKGDLPEATQEAVVSALQSMGVRGELARRLLQDSDAMGAYLGVMYEWLKNGGTGHPTGP